MRIGVAVVVSLREYARLRGKRAPFGVVYNRFLTISKVPSAAQVSGA